MSVRSLSAAALVAAAAAVAAPSAGACDPCGYDACSCTVAVVAYDPCCEPPAPTLRERIAAKRIARLERRQDRIRGRFADPCCEPYGAAPAYHAGYGPTRGGLGYGSPFGPYGYGY